MTALRQTAILSHHTQSLAYVLVSNSQLVLFSLSTKTVTEGRSWPSEGLLLNQKRHLWPTENTKGSPWILRGGRPGLPNKKHCLE